MAKNMNINVEEILTDSDTEGYRFDGFRILAKMIARRYMSDMSLAQPATCRDTSRQENLSESKLENKGE